MAEFYFVYILRCADQSLYIGQTNNLARREKEHNSGGGALYTARRIPVKVVYTEKFLSRRNALNREKQIKSWSRKKKENLIKYGHPTKFWAG